MMFLTVYVYPEKRLVQCRGLELDVTHKDGIDPSENDHRNLVLSGQVLQNT